MGGPKENGQLLSVGYFRVRDLEWSVGYEGMAEKMGMEPDVTLTDVVICGGPWVPVKATLFLEFKLKPTSP